jgi:hypothetical protein
MFGQGLGTRREEGLKGKEGSESPKIFEVQLKGRNETLISPPGTMNSPIPGRTEYPLMCHLYLEL